MDIVACSLVSLLTRFTYTIQKYMANKDSLYQSLSGHDYGLIMSLR